VAGQDYQFCVLGGLLPGRVCALLRSEKLGSSCWTRCLARALATGNTVNAIAPGTISFPGDAPEIAKTSFAARRCGADRGPEDIDEPSFFLAQSPFITAKSS